MRIVLYDKMSPIQKLILFAFLAVIAGFMLRSCMLNFVEAQRRARSTMPERYFRCFSFDVADPAEYWGEFSIQLEIEHDRFDAILYNPHPVNMEEGYVILGMREGKVVCFYVDNWGRRKLAINGRIFPWYDPLLASSGRPPAKLAAVAGALKQKEIDDLRALARLVRDNEICRRMYERSNELLIHTEFLHEFDRDTESIAKMKQKLMKKRSAGTSPTATILPPGIQTSGSATLK